MAERTNVAIWPRWRAWLLLIAASAFGFTLYAWAPEPLAMIDAGGRPSTPLAAIKWGGMLIAVLALARIFGLRRIGAGPDGITVATLLKRKRYDWSDLTAADLDEKTAGLLGYRLRFGGTSIQLAKRDYAKADIAALREMVRVHRSLG